MEGLQAPTACCPRRNPMSVPQQSDGSASASAPVSAPVSAPAAQHDTLPSTIDDSARHNSVDDARMHRPGRLINRKAEAAELLAAHDAVMDSGLARLVLVRGYTGIGKSTLVQGLREPLLR